MNDFLVMRSFPNGNGPSVEKVRRDGILMYCEAHYVIVLDEEGNITERIDRPITSTGNYLVVLAPVIYKGQKINYSVVLEIGFRRAVPYNQFEKCFENERFTVKGRTPVTKLTDEKIVSLLSEISSKVKLVALEETKHWKEITYGGESKKRSKRILWKCGIYASIPSDEEILCYAIYLLDLEARKIYLKQKIFFIRYWLRRFKSANYSRKQLRTYAGAKKVSEMIINANYPEHHLDFLFNGLSHKNKELLELCVRAFLPEPDEGAEYKELIELLETPPAPEDRVSLQKKYRHLSSEIKQGWKLFGYIWESRNTRRVVHAKNSLRFEIGLDESDRLNHQH